MARRKLGRTGRLRARIRREMEDREFEEMAEELSMLEMVMHHEYSTVFHTC